MFDRLATFAERRRRWIVIGAVAFSVAAGAIAGGVADLLSGYGADDPETESVIANERLEDAGYRGTGAIVLICGVDVRTQAGRAEVDALNQRIEGQREVQGTRWFGDDGSPQFVSDDGEATYIAVSFSPADESEPQDAAEHLQEALAESRRSRSVEPRSPASRSASGSKATSRAPSCSPSRSSSCSRCCSFAAWLPRCCRW